MKARIKTWDTLEREFGVDYSGMHPRIDVKGLPFTTMMDSIIGDDRILEVRPYEGEYLCSLDGVIMSFNRDMIEAFVDSFTLDDLREIIGDGRFRCNYGSENGRTESYSLSKHCLSGYDSSGCYRMIDFEDIDVNCIQNLYRLVEIKIR